MNTPTWFHDPSYRKWLDVTASQIQRALDAGNRITLLRRDDEKDDNKLPLWKGFNDPSVNSWTFPDFKTQTKWALGKGIQITGYGFVNGSMSKNRFALDFDRGDKLPEIASEVLTDTGIDIMQWPRVRSGRETTPGYHIHGRTTESLKSATLVLLKDDPFPIVCELKAQGVQVVGPGSRHKSGRLYEVEHGDVFNPPVTDLQDVERVLRVIRSFNQVEAPLLQPRSPRVHAPRAYEPGTDSLSIIDRYNSETSIESALEQYGYMEGSGNYYKHPRNDSGESVHLLADNKAYHYGANDPYGTHKTSTPFALFAHFEHGRDGPKAVKHLAHQYGIESKPLKIDVQDGMWESNADELLVDPTTSTTQVDDDELPEGHPEMWNPPTMDAEKWLNHCTLNVRSSEYSAIELVEPPILIEGLLRKGEIMNLVSSPKMKKSWMVADLARTLANGGRWLGRFECQKSKVLIVDNELHEFDIRKRIGAMQKSRPSQASYDFVCLRDDGLDDLEVLANKLANYAGRYDLIVFDALYRFFPEGMDENSNTDWTHLINREDAIARETGCAIINVHHASKGVQSNKSTADSGSGAGAQSRAVDAHVVLKAMVPEGEPQADAPELAVMAAVVRSFAPVPRIYLQWEFPFWHEVTPPDEAVKTESRKSRVWTVRDFAETFATSEGETRTAIIERATEQMARNRARELFDSAEATGHLKMVSEKQVGGCKKKTPFYAIPDEPNSFNSLLQKPRF